MEYFGHVGVENGGYHMAYCSRCQSIVFMTGKERHKSYNLNGNILDYLDVVAKCCGHPHYHFGNIIPFNEIKRVCPECKQIIN